MIISLIKKVWWNDRPFPLQRQDASWRDSICISVDCEDEPWVGLALSSSQRSPISLWGRRYGWAASANYGSFRVGFGVGVCSRMPFRTPSVSVYPGLGPAPSEAGLPARWHLQFYDHYPFDYWWSLIEWVILELWLLSEGLSFGSVLRKCLGIGKDADLRVSYGCVCV